MLPDADAYRLLLARFTLPEHSKMAQVCCQRHASVRDEHRSLGKIDFHRYGKQVTDDAVLGFARRGGAHLLEVNLYGCFQITDTGLQSLARHCKNLRVLNLTNVRLVTTN